MTHELFVAGVLMVAVGMLLCGRSEAQTQTVSDVPDALIERMPGASTGEMLGRSESGAEWALTSAGHADDWLAGNGS